MQIVLPSIAVMITLMMYRRKVYNLPLLKTILIILIWAVSGVLSTFVLYFIESGEWGGRSYFGSIFFIPIIFSLFSKVFKLPFLDIIDYLSLPTILMFAIMKADCAMAGCCSGRMLWYSNDGKVVCFPSPIVEALSTLLLIAVLLYFEHIGKTKRHLYSICLIAFGILRFVLNFFRSSEEHWSSGFPKGNVWALISIVYGIMWIFILAYIDVNKKYKEIKSV